MKEYFSKNKTYILTFIFSFLFGVAVFCLYFFLKGQSLKDAIDACSLSGVVLLAAGLLVVIARLGAFDTFSFAFRQTVTSMFSKKPNEYNSLSDYKIAKYDSRKNKKPTQLMFFLSGLIFILAVVVLEIILHSINK